MILLQVRSKEDVLTCARHIHTDSLAPVFLTSSVTGDGLELVKLFFNLLPQRHKWADRVRHIYKPRQCLCAALEKSPIL